MIASSKLVRLALASVSLLSAAGAFVGPGVSRATASDTCPGKGCKGGNTFCATITVSGTTVSCWTSQS